MNLHSAELTSHRRPESSLFPLVGPRQTQNPPTYSCLSSQGLGHSLEKSVSISAALQMSAISSCSRRNRKCSTLAEPLTFLHCRPRGQNFPCTL